jgi:hypothetical protein
MEPCRHWIEVATGAVEASRDYLYNYLVSQSPKKTPTDVLAHATAKQAIDAGG